MFTSDCEGCLNLSADLLHGEAGNVHAPLGTSSLTQTATFTLGLVDYDNLTGLYSLTCRFFNQRNGIIWANINT